MKNVKSNLSKLPLASNPPKLNPTKKIKAKNLSPAKKFRLRLRRAKFQKQQQEKDDYFEHDNRDAARAAGEEKKKAGRLYRKGRRAQMYIDAYLKSQQHMSQNGDTASPDETQDSSNGNEVSMKSIVHRANIKLLPMTSRFGHAFGKEQAAHNGRKLSATHSSFPTTNNNNVNASSSLAGNTSIVKCCCHCACSGRKKKARRKLSSPYFGDFNRTMSFANGSCAGASAEVTTKILNKTTTTTHHETLVKAAGLVDYKKLAAAKMKHRQLVPVLTNNYKLQGRSGGGCGMKEMRSVIRFVLESWRFMDDEKLCNKCREKSFSGCECGKLFSAWQSFEEMKQNSVCVPTNVCIICFDM